MASHQKQKQIKKTFTLKNKKNAQFAQFEHCWLIITKFGTDISNMYD